MIIYEPTWKSYVVTTTQPIFSPDECNTIIKLGKDLPHEEGNVGFGAKNKIDHKIRRNEISWIPFSKAKWMYSKIEHWMHTVNNKHMGFNQLQIGEYAQFTKYSKKEHYDWHADSSYEMSKGPAVRKVSMILLLNDPKEFKGGALQIVDKKQLLVLKQGEAVFFASFIAHRVVPLTKGNRFSLTMWFGGPPLI